MFRTRTVDVGLLAGPLVVVFALIVVFGAISIAPPASWLLDDATGKGQ